MNAVIHIISQYPHFTLFCFALLTNIPCGYIREGVPKFSGRWLFWVHASIPFIIFLRHSLEISNLFIPLSIFYAVIGQMIGGKKRRKDMTKKERLALKQLPEKIREDKNINISDNDVVVTLLNMGGPKTNEDVEDFQKHLFLDPLLIRFPLSFLLQGLFAKLLITFRLKAVKERYQLIGGGSPIYTSTENQVKALKEELKRRGRDIDVIYSFNYSPPFSEDTIQYVKNASYKYLLPLSLYPHYSKATTGSNLHYLKKAAKDIYPECKFLSGMPYYLHDGYIQAFVERINEEINSDESLDDFYIVFSAHGLPLYFLKEGDPYPFQISQTVARILAGIKRLDNWMIAYQSAVGPFQWLKPATEDVLEQLAGEGAAKVLVVPVSFVGDHIETSCEIDIEYREMARKWEITDFRMSKAIECHPGFIKALADTVENTLSISRIIKSEDLQADVALPINAR